MTLNHPVLANGDFIFKLWTVSVNSLLADGFCMNFCRLLIFFQNQCFQNILRMSNSLDPDQARLFVGPDLGLNCLLRLLADHKSYHQLGKSQVCISS